jgi:hypothetical protein
MLEVYVTSYEGIRGTRTDCLAKFVIGIHLR